MNLEMNHFVCRLDSKFAGFILKGINELIELFSCLFWIPSEACVLQLSSYDLLFVLLFGLLRAFNISAREVKI